jgi:hypothetical protein
VNTIQIRGVLTDVLADEPALGAKVYLVKLDTGFEYETAEPKLAEKAARLHRQEAVLSFEVVGLGNWRLLDVEPWDGSGDIYPAPIDPGYEWRMTVMASDALSSTARLLCHTLSLSAYDEEGNWSPEKAEFPSLQELAAGMRSTEDEALAALAELEQAGFLIRFGGDGS